MPVANFCHFSTQAVNASQEQKKILQKGSGLGTYERQRDVCLTSVMKLVQMPKICWQKRNAVFHIYLQQTALSEQTDAEKIEYDILAGYDLFYFFTELPDKRKIGLYKKFLSYI